MARTTSTNDNAVVSSTTRYHLGTLPTVRGDVVKEPLPTRNVIAHDCRLEEIRRLQATFGLPEHGNVREKSARLSV
jgi:hypothetical protein